MKDLLLISLLGISGGSLLGSLMANPGHRLEGAGLGGLSSLGGALAGIYPGSYISAKAGIPLGVPTALLGVKTMDLLEREFLGKKRYKEIFD